MAQTTYPQLMGHLKKVLKKQNTSYALLANTMNVPESTLKKWFNAEDGSFNRIASISEALGISLPALLKAVEDQSVLTVTFSDQQQKLFLKERRCFEVYWFLVYERMKSADVQIRLNLTEKALVDLLLKLDKHNLIRLEPGNKVRVPKMKPVKWKFDGAFMQALLKEWSDGVISQASRDTRLTLQFFQLSENSAEELMRDLAGLEEKYSRRTILELGADMRRSQVRYLSATAEGSFI